MPVASVYQFNVPAPYDASFVNGEKALSVATPLANAAARTTFYLARWFDFEGGTYTIKCLSDDAATWIASVEKGNGRILFSSVVSAGVAEYEVFIPRGRKRLDITLVNMSTTTSSCYVAFSIWQYGKLVYASTGDGWVFDTAQIADSALAAAGDIRLTYPVFSVKPNWADPVVERISWSTDAMSSESDEEQRRSVRRYPRRSFEASFLRKGYQRARLDNFFAGVGQDECLVPLWHEQYTITGTLGSTLTFPFETLQWREFNVGDLCVVYQSPTDYEILEVDSLDLLADTLTFVDAPVGTWPAGSKVIPLRVARVIDAARFEHLTDDTSTVQARFELKEPFKGITGGSWGACAPLFGFKIDRRGSISVDFARSTFMLDNETGVVDITDPGIRTRVSTRASLTLFGRKQMIAWRSFLQNARGRAVRFWFPDLMAHVYPVGDISGLYFDAVDNGFTEYLQAPQDARKMLVIIFKDGRTPFYRTISTVTRVGEYERFTVTIAFPTIPLADIERVTFVMPSRFDQDSFEFQHIVDNSAVIRSGIVLKSSDDDDLPPIECFVTSKPYPVDVLDGLDITPSIAAASLAEFNYPPESLDITFDVHSVTLVELVVSFTASTENLDITFDVESVTLESVLVEYDMLAEALDITPSIAGAALDVALISYENWPDEALDITPSIVGGTLG